MNILTIAQLTIREAARRRLFLALLLLTALVIALSGWGFSRLPTLQDRNGALSDVAVRFITSQLFILVMYTFSFVVALSAVFVASPAVSGEVESGIALALLARPVARREYLAGKWIGLAFLVAAYVVAVTIAELGVVLAVVGYTPPEPGQFIVYLAAEGLVCLTLALALSTRLSGMVGGIIALVFFGVAWLGGVIGGLGAVFANDAITQVGVWSRILFPTDLLWRGAVWSLEPAATRLIAANAGPAALATPFFAAGPPETAWIFWSVAWVVGVFALSVLSFERREI